MAGQQAHVADGGLGVVAAEAGLGGEPLGGGGVAVGVVVVGGVEPAHQPVGRRAEQGGDRAELLQGLAPGRAVEIGGGRGVQVRAEGAADPERVRDAGEAPAGGGQGASRSVWRAHHEPPPSAGRREHADEAHAVAGNCRGGALARLRPRRCGPAEPGGSAGDPPGGNPRGAARPWGARSRGAAFSPHITRSIDVNQRLDGMIIYSISCRLRHRHEIEWEMSQAGTVR